MATVNFSVPDDVRDAFNEAFAGQNKSAVIAALMREAVQRQQRQARSRAAIRRILARRDRAPVAGTNELDAARRAGRP
ncbi:hypothetical protein G6N75_02000 [Thioalkalivibrio sp. XN8]|nr:hypothetical protein [Thioalkalivibrio sp. XN8]